MTTHYLTANGIADRVGLSHTTIRSYQRDGLLPEPDAVLGTGNAVKHGWLPETIDAWNAKRRGRGRPRKS